MAHLVNKDFAELAADGSNYLAWAMDVKIILTTKVFNNTIEEPNAQAPILDEAKYTTLYFLRHHLHPDLKNECMMEENPRALWVALKDRYDRQKAIILLEARREWSLLHLMDFKSVAEYNSAVHKICSKLHFYDQPVNDAEKIEKMLSTFLPTNRLLQQQYCRHNYAKYSDLIYDLLQAEKHDEILTKNHQIRPMGTSPLPEVHHNSQNTQKKFGSKKFKKNFKGKWKNKNKHHYQKNKDSHKGKGTYKKNFHHDNSQVCQRCGCRNHITKKCHFGKHLVELYQKSVGKQVQGDKFEAHFTTQPTDASCSKNTPMENNNEKIPLQMDDLFSTDNMLVEFQSSDIFGDTN
jgi:hypothetical protein